MVVPDAVYQVTAVYLALNSVVECAVSAAGDWQGRRHEGEIAAWCGFSRTARVADAVMVERTGRQVREQYAMTGHQARIRCRLAVPNRSPILYGAAGSLGCCPGDRGSAWPCHVCRNAILKRHISLEGAKFCFASGSPGNWAEDNPVRIQNFRGGAVDRGGGKQSAVYVEGYHAVLDVQLVMMKRACGIERCKRYSLACRKWHSVLIAIPLLAIPTVT